MAGNNQVVAQATSTHYGKSKTASSLGNFGNAKQLATTKVGEKAPLALSGVHGGNIRSAVTTTTGVQDQFDFNHSEDEAASATPDKMLLGTQRQVHHKNGFSRAKMSQKSKPKSSQQSKKLLSSRLRTTKKSGPSASAIDWCADDSFSFN